MEFGGYAFPTEQGYRVPGEDTEISSIRDRVQLGTGDEGWAIHTDGSLRYRGPVVVPQLV